MRVEKLKDEFKSMPKKDRERLRKHVKYRDLRRSQEFLKNPELPIKSTKNDESNISSHKAPAHKQTYSKIDPQIFDSDEEIN
jgi:hypothetical protein